MPTRRHAARLWLTWWSRLHPHGEEAPTGPRVARPDDRLRAVSNHEGPDLARGHPSRRRFAAPQDEGGACCGNGGWAKRLVRRGSASEGGSVPTSPSGVLMEGTALARL